MKYTKENVQKYLGKVIIFTNSTCRYKVKVTDFYEDGTIRGLFKCAKRSKDYTKLLNTYTSNCGQGAFELHDIKSIKLAKPQKY